MINQKPILLVEDDLVDALTVRRAFKELGVKNELLHSQNGEEALFLLQDPSGVEPTLILLDLNMPRMGGLEFLEIIKADERAKHIPIVILTTSTEHQDRLMSYRFNVEAISYKNPLIIPILSK